MRKLLLLTCLALAGAAASGAAYGDAQGSLELPTPQAARVQQDELIKVVGGRVDRLLKSDVPGPVVNDEVVQVGLGGDGGVVTVTAEQRLQLRGEGDYAIRERGPARSATSLSAEPPPVTRLGAVVWQGFSPGRRELSARLVLDPLIEAPHLPLAVQVSFTGPDGATGLLAGDRVPGVGTVTVTVTNTTSQPQVLPTATDVSAALVAPLLDRALSVARRPSPARLPSTDLGLPARLPVTGGARIQASQAVPMRLSGSLRLAGTTGTVEGPATTAVPDGATFVGTLGGSSPQNAGASVTFTVKANGPGRLLLDLSAVGALNQSELAPPNGFADWGRWAAASPPLAERKAALDLLVAVAATGARASSYSPYLGADLVGSGSTTFTFAFAPPPERVAVAQRLTPRWGAISLAGLAALLLLTHGVLLWRRS